MEKKKNYITKPTEIKYKNYTMNILDVDHFGMKVKSCYIYKDNTLITHFTASKNYKDKDAIKELEFLYKNDLEKKVLEILKPRIKIKSSLLEDKNVCFIEASGFVFKDSEEYEVLKEWLDL